MLLFGLGMASWVTRTPAIRDALDASTGQMGLILFGLSIGSMAGVLASGRLVARVGSRVVIACGCVSVVIGVALIGVSALVGLSAGVFTGLLLFGAGMGLSEIAINIEGADIERASGRTFLPLLHGCFSLGTALGALVGIALTATDFPVIWHLALIAVVLAALALWAVPRVPARTLSAPAATSNSDAPTKTGSIWRGSGLALIAVIVLAMAFAEGSANDWLPILIVDAHNADAVFGSLIYAGFAAMMTVGRFIGGPLVDRVGRRPILQLSAIFAIVGVLAVSYAPNLIVATVAVIFWGLGASLGFPVAISAAGENPDRSEQRVSAVATSGYLAFLVGPPLLGFLGEHIGLPQAMLTVTAILTLALACTTRLPQPRKLTTQLTTSSDACNIGSPLHQKTDPHRTETP